MTTYTATELDSLIDSWTLDLRAKPRSPRTIASYRNGLRAYRKWAEADDAVSLDRRSVSGFIVYLLEEKQAAAATASTYVYALTTLVRWLDDEREIDHADAQEILTKIRPPKPNTTPVQPLTDQQIKDLLATCDNGTMWDRRDEALIRFLAETGVRANEVLSLRTEDVDLSRNMALVRIGKGGDGRVVPFSVQCARALDRYMRARRKHKHGAHEFLWLSIRGTLKYHGLSQMLIRRADRAGISGMHPHLFRHTASTRWLEKGGSEGGLMSMTGWKSRTMLDRYVAATAATRAAEEARRLNLGDF